VYEVSANWILFGEGGESPQYQADYVQKKELEAAKKQIEELRSELIIHQREKIKELQENNF
jgi:hypothetical protein